MSLTIALPKKPRCVLLYAMAPKGLHPAKANTAINTLIGYQSIPLCLYHDHFIGQPGGLAIFDIRELSQIDTIVQAVTELLPDWAIDLRPLVFSHNPAAFDEQIAYTQQAYGNADWERLRREERPSYCDPGRETELASDAD